MCVSTCVCVCVKNKKGTSLIFMCFDGMFVYFKLFSNMFGQKHTRTCHPDFHSVTRKESAITPCKVQKFPFSAPQTKVLTSTLDQKSTAKSRPLIVNGYFFNSARADITEIQLCLGRWHLGRNLVDRWQTKKKKRALFCAKARGSRVALITFNYGFS